MGANPSNLHVSYLIRHHFNLLSVSSHHIFGVFSFTWKQIEKNKCRLACLDLNGNDHFLHAPLRPKPSLIIPVCSQAGMAASTHGFKPLIRLRANPDSICSFEGRSVTRERISRKKNPVMKDRDETGDRGEEEKEDLWWLPCTHPHLTSSIIYLVYDMKASRGRKSS